MTASAPPQAQRLLSVLNHRPPILYLLPQSTTPVLCVPQTICLTTPRSSRIVACPDSPGTITPVTQSSTEQFSQPRSPDMCAIAPEEEESCGARKPQPASAIASPRVVSARRMPGAKLDRGEIAHDRHRGREAVGDDIRERRRHRLRVGQAPPERDVLELEQLGLGVIGREAAGDPLKLVAADRTERRREGGLLGEGPDPAGLVDDALPECVEPGLLRTPDAAADEDLAR